MRVVVTGANGFLGSAICTALANRGHSVVAFVRDRESSANLTCDSAVFTGPIEQMRVGENAMRGVDAVVHTAGWSGKISKSLTAEYVCAVNIAATATLAEMALRSGVRQFIYISSIKAMGDRTTIQPFNAAAPARPVDLYGRSKLLAETAALKFPGISVSIIRPPAVYGPGMKGSLLSLFRLADRRFPLPLGAIRNSRDFLSLQSLQDLVCACAERPLPKNRIFLASDGRSFSSPAWYTEIAASLGKEVRLLYCPSPGLKLALSVAGQSELATSLLYSLQIDDNATRSDLGWSPAVSVRDSLRVTAKWFVENGMRSTSQRDGFFG